METPKHLPISVIIPTMNRPKTLARTIEKYLNSSCIPKQFVIVDQSNDVFVQNQIEGMCKQYNKHSQFDYFYQDIPSSTKARNEGMRLAIEDILIFSDDDVDVYYDTILNVYNVMSDVQVAMIAAIDDNMPQTNSSIGYLLGTKSYFNRKIGHITLSVLGRYPSVVKGIVDTQWAMGYFFVVRKSLCREWKISWDERLSGYAYAEDLDFSYSYYKNASLREFKCILHDKVRVKHMVSREYRVPTKKSTYAYILNRLYLSYKHNMGGISRVAMAWCNFWMLILSIIRRENFRDMAKAIMYGMKHRNEIAKGILRCPE